ncbi:cytochrome c [Inquilinus sp. Marseille-Q2685]|uniref:c-type cytochrome n=1 Tax=Inquilinus sp. Marseille-Q2685 TaxID=2866581 RepID=UPI001CE43E1A|nr:cytochrome c [Inquilinus sp. Marseille-Q2685]
MTALRPILMLLAVLLPATSARAQDARPAHIDYMLKCSGCHGADGSGSPDRGIPDFRGYVDGFGRTEAGRTYVMHVPGVVNSSLSDARIAAVMNYVVASFGAPATRSSVRPFTAEEVGRLRAVPVPDVVAYRREVAADLTRAGIPVAGYPWP